MKNIFKYLFIVIISLIISGCSRSEFQTDFKTYSQNSVIKDNTAIILFGIKGNNTVNYLQFMSNKALPALNYRNLNVQNGILALKVHVPLEYFRFGVFSVGKAGYVVAGGFQSSYGYISVKSKPIEINKKGIYFYGILDTDKRVINQTMSKEFLNLSKEKYKDLLRGLEPINFNW